jgi:hypothetical protein
VFDNDTGYCIPRDLILSKPVDGVCKEGMVPLPESPGLCVSKEEYNKWADRQRALGNNIPDYPEDSAPADSYESPSDDYNYFNDPYMDSYWRNRGYWTEGPAPAPSPPPPRYDVTVPDEYPELAKGGSINYSPLAELSPMDIAPPPSGLGLEDLRMMRMDPNYIRAGLSSLMPQQQMQQAPPMAQQMMPQMPAQGMGMGMGSQPPPGESYAYNPTEGYNFGFAAGGSVTEYQAGGTLLKGPGDGMSDDIVANIEGRQEARLADGEFVIPADVVSHLGNGSTEAGAKKLYEMMDRIRKARTGRTRQAPEVNADKFLPK